MVLNSIVLFVDRINRLIYTGNTYLQRQYWSCNRCSSITTFLALLTLLKAILECFYQKTHVCWSSKASHSFFLIIFFSCRWWRKPHLNTYLYNIYWTLWIPASHPKKSWPPLTSSMPRARVKRGQSFFCGAIRRSTGTEGWTCRLLLGEMSWGCAV